MEETKEVVQEITQETPAINQEEIASSVFDKLKSLFTTKEEVVEETKVNIDEIVNQKVNEKLSEVIPKAKKEKELELKAKIEEVEQEKINLENQKKQEELTAQIKELADENFIDYLSFQANNGIDIVEFIEKNPQYAKKKAPVQSINEAGAKGTSLSTRDKEIYEKLKKQGII